MSDEGISLAGRRGPVIIVDDNEMDAYLTRRCYEKSQLPNEILWLTSGTEVLRYLADAQESKTEMPALILLDINMPGMDGFETLRRIRGDQAFPVIPMIVIFTNSSDPKDRENSLELGADAFVTKSPNVDDLIAFFDSLAAA